MSRLIFVVFVLLLASVAPILHAAPEFPSIEGGRLGVVPFPKELPPDRRPRVVRWLSSAPDGALTRANRPECSAASFEEAVLRGERDLQARFDRCEKHLKRWSAPQFWKLLKLIAVEYDLHHHRMIREVRIGIGDNVYRRGLLAMKSGRRPLVIIQCGLFCDIYDIETKVLLMHLYDGTPFHVLAVGSVTGLDYLRSNSPLKLGGFDEGHQLLELIDLLTASDEPISKLVSSVHLVGASLGAHAVFYSGLYGSARERNPLASGIALCPVVNYKDAVENLASGGSMARALGLQAWDILRRILNGAEDSELRRLGRLPPTQLARMVEEVGYRQYAGKRDWLPAPLRELELRERADFWRLGEFETHAAGLKMPVFAWASQDDSVVVPAKNIARLRGHPFVTTLMSRRGLHCAAPSYYGWDMATVFLRGQILTKSGSFLNGRVSRSRALDVDAGLHDGETYFSYEWEAKAKHLELRVKIWNPSGRVGNGRCGAWDPYFAFEGCFRRVTKKIRYGEISASELFAPRTEGEEDSLTRWANSSLRVVDSVGRILHHTTRRPQAIQWFEYPTQ